MARDNGRSGLGPVRPDRTHFTLTDWLVVAYKSLRSGLIVAGIWLFAQPAQLFRRYWLRKRAAGERIYVEDLPGAHKLKPHERRANGPEPASPPAPKSHPFKARTMRHGAYPDDPPVFVYRDPPLSGRTLAGVGEAQFRRCPKFYHTGLSKIYGAINQAFLMVQPLGPLLGVLKVAWDNRRATGPVAKTRRTVSDPAAMSEEIKSYARKLGATQVGCTPVVKEALYDYVEEVLPHAIVVAVPMARDEMLNIPSVESSDTIHEGYVEVGHVAIRIAERIRAMGWNAEADTNLLNAPSKVLHIPLAVNAGLGTMGRHTSLITRENGANVRLATVLTDLPLVFDEPVDFGVEQMCMDCRVCRENCPSNAIYEEKQMVRGVKKWHLDFDRCMPYFNEQNTCGVCITVCPWSETGKGPLTALMQQTRMRTAKSYPEPLPVSERWQVLGPAKPHAEVPRDVDPEDWWRDVTLARREERAGGGIQIFELRDPGGRALPDWAAGAHVEVMLPSGRVRPYSLSNPPDDRTVWRLGVKIEADGTGGSAELGSLAEGQILRVSRPGNNYPLQERSHSRFVLCAGGIGVTVMVPIAHRLAEIGIPFNVHYSVRDKSYAVFADELRGLSGGNFCIHTERDWLDSFLDGRPDDVGICACGPSGYMDAVRDKAVASALSETIVYTEDFGSRKENKPFDLVLASSGERLRIGAGQTIARELGRRGVHVPISCGHGICGTCTAGLLEGEQDARDRIFTEKERETKITLCCSRAAGESIVIDL